MSDHSKDIQQYREKLEDAKSSAMYSFYVSLIVTIAITAAAVVSVAFYLGWIGTESVDPEEKKKQGWVLFLIIVGMIISALGAFMAYRSWNKVSQLG